MSEMTANADPPVVPAEELLAAGKQITCSEVEAQAREYFPAAYQLAAEIIEAGSDSSDTELALFFVHGDGNSQLTSSVPRQPPESLVAKIAERRLGCNHIHFIELHQMPLNPDCGEVDRRMLQKIGSIFITAKRRDDWSRISTWTESEIALHYLWAKVLAVDVADIEYDTSFFHLGGDSAAAMRLVAEARILGIHLSVALIFQHPTLKDLAESLEDVDEDSYKICEPFSLLPNHFSREEFQGSVSRVCGVKSESIVDVYPCTPLQEGLLALSERRSGEYMGQMVMEISATVEIDRLCAAWEQTVALTPILRTRMVQLSGVGLVQCIVDEEVSWVIAQGLDAYLESDRSKSMKLGDALSRHAIITDENKRHLVLSMHHAVYDRISMQLIQELFSRLMRDEQLDSAPQFCLFVSHILEKNQASAEAFWEWNLLNYDGRVFPELPARVNDPHATASTEVEMAIPKLAESNITTSTLLRAAWGLLIRQYSGSQDVVFGAVVSGRNAPLPGIESVIAPTIATVPIRLVIDPESSVVEYLEAVQEQSMEMIPAEQFGLQNIAKVSQEAERACQFQSLVIIQPPMRDRKAQEGELGVWRPQPLAGEVTSYALTMVFELSEDTIRIISTYDSRVIEDWEMSKMIDYLIFAFELLVQQNPNQTLGDIGISTSDLEAIWCWNHNAPVAYEKCVHEMIFERAIARPEAPAISAWDGSLAYQELDVLSSTLANHLMDLQVKPGDIVPLCFQKSMWTVLSVLAVLKAGATFLLLDTTQPENRLESIISQVDFGVMLTSLHTESISNRFANRTVVVNQGLLSNLKFSTGTLPTISPSSNAYIVFTSGTTGQPKGVMVPHSSFSSAIFHQSGHDAFGPDERVYDFASFAFDVSINNILKTLASGACLCIPSEHDRINNLAQSIHEFKATLAYLTPSVSRLLDPSQLPHLRTLALGGEKTTPDVLEAWYPYVKVIDTYGPAECTPVSTISKEPGRSGIGIGMGVNTWLVDPEDSDKLVPVGVPGELVLEGPLIGHGYVGDPERTRETFIADPSWLTDGIPSSGIYGRSARLYKTGDLASYFVDGSLRYLGRKDTQVKVRGQRIELGEIEHHVRQAVPEAKGVAVQLTSSPDTEELVMFLVLEKGQSLPGSSASLDAATPECYDVPQEISAQLAERLPRYMIPTTMVIINQLPLNTSGKTDQMALRRIIGRLLATGVPGQGKNHSDAKERGPSSSSECALQQLWADLLSIETHSIMAEHSFFRLGGDSISAMKLVAEARRKGLEFTVADVFSHPRLEDLALVATAPDNNPQQPLPPFSLVGSGHLDRHLEGIAEACGVSVACVQDAYPCTPLQEGLLALTFQQPGDYQLQTIMTLNKATNTNWLREAWGSVVALVPILRTRIIQLEDLGLLQVVLDERPGWTTSGHLESYLQSDKLQPMKLGDALSRTAIVTDSKSQNVYFVWTVHHALYDATSLRSIQGLFSDFLQRDKPKAPTGFNEFIRYINEDGSPSLEDYWKAELSGFEADIFPLLPRNVTSLNAECRLETKWNIPHRRDNDITMATMIRAALALAINRHSGVHDVVFGAVLSGRNAPIIGVEDIIGPTIATVPIRVPLLGSVTIQSYLERLQEQARQMIPFEHIGLQNIAKLHHQAEQATKFQALLVIQPTGDTRDEVTEIGTWQPLKESKEFASHALTLLCHLNPDCIQVTVLYDDRVVPRWKMARIVDSIGWALEQIINQPLGTTLGELDAVTTRDVHDIWQWNRELPPMIDRCVHDFLADKVNTQPNAQAVDAPDQDFTYAQLDSISSLLACRLVLSGIRPGEIVPLIFEKSAWTIVAMLAVMKAGAAFAPVDPTQAEDRRRRILKQTKARFVLTSERYSEIMKQDECEYQVIPVGPATAKINVAEEDTNDQPSLPLINPDALICVIFTSGSTGEPKGVALEHRAVSTSCYYHGSRLGFDQSTRNFQFAHYIFDPSLSEIFATLVFGGCVCVPSDEERTGNISGAMERMNITFIGATPTVAKLIEPRDHPNLQSIMLAGESTTVEGFERWLQNPATKVFHGFGPTECAILCLLGEYDSNQPDPHRIGTAVGCVAWVVDQEDVQKLAPIGSVGELLIEGPILARGYLGDPERTKAAFIDAPLWLLRGGRSGKLYRTGDLVSYGEDGGIHFVGRKDTQYKIRGQRVELGEVEQQVSKAFPHAQHVAVEVITPAGTGFGNPMVELAAFMALKDKASLSLDWACTYPELEDVHVTDTCFAVRVPTSLEDHLAERLPRHMIPTSFFVVDALPRSATGKADRKQLKRIGSLFSVGQLVELRNTTQECNKRKPSTETEVTLQHIIARTLNVDPGLVGLDDSFYRLGGDSITSMQVSSAARERGIDISTTQILQKKTIARILASSKPSLGLGKTVVERSLVAPGQAFPLTPVQKLYLDLQKGLALDRIVFDQFFWLKPKGHVAYPDLLQALYSLTMVHSMLRARLRKISSGEWEQFLIASPSEAIILKHCDSLDENQMSEEIEKCRGSINIENGPAVSSVLFDNADGSQMIFISIHHLIIDLMSWRILLNDMEDLVSGRPLQTITSVPFPTWATLQDEYVKSHANFDNSLLLHVPSDFLYWGIEDKISLTTDITSQGFRLDSAATSMLLGQCNEAFATRPSELMIAALFYSFSLVFPDRKLPTIFNESHGREVWDESLDLSRTVGWFTTIHPIHLDQQKETHGMSLLDIVKRTKDSIRKVPYKGWEFFSSQFANEESVQGFESQFCLEFVFNFGGLYQQMERDDALFQYLEPPIIHYNPQTSVGARRFSLFEVNTSVIRGELGVDVFFDKRICQQERICTWIREFQSILVDMVNEFPKIRLDWTLSDFPSAFSSYDTLSQFKRETLPALGLQLGDVEDIFPCSSMQEGILMSQAKCPSHYQTRMELHLSTQRMGQFISLDRVEQAWRDVVKRHQLLRAVILDRFPGSTRSMLLIVQNPSPVIKRRKFRTGVHYETNNEEPPPTYGMGDLRHRVTITRISDTEARLIVDMDHTITDAHSRGILIKDLRSAYNGSLAIEGPSFSSFIAHLGQRPLEEGLSYWKSYLSGTEPCYFPALGGDRNGEDVSFQVPGIDSNHFRKVCSNLEVTMAVVIQLAWAVVLSQFSSSATPSFGMLTSGRDSDLGGIDDIFGPLMAILPCRVDTKSQISIAESLKVIQADYLEALPHQGVPLASIHNAIGLGTMPLFNTVVSVQRADQNPFKSGSSTLDVSVLGGSDPTEVK